MIVHDALDLRRRQHLLPLPRPPLTKKVLMGNLRPLA
jgi:hypothetical protein